MEKQVIGELPFDRELFKLFMDDVVINQKCRKSIFYSPMFNLVTDKYNTFVWQEFLGFCKASHPNYVSFDDLYDFFKTIKVSTFNKLLGSGGYGGVFECRDNLVYKKHYSENGMSYSVPFYKWCMNNESDVTPKVYRLGKLYVVMEKVKMYTSKCMLLDKVFKEGVYDMVRLDYEHFTTKDIRMTDMDHDHLFAYDWLEKCENIFNKINSTLSERENHLRLSFRNLAISNFGERENGDIIYFDPQ